MATDIFPESREEEILVSTINGEEYNKAPESRIEALLLELKEVIEEGGGGGGTTNYNLLQNKPSINSVTLTGDKTSADLGIPTDADLADKQDVLPVTASGNDVTFNGDIIDGQGNTLSVLAEALTKTASGNPVVISDCAGGKARSLKTTIEAIQDLHGYDHPWAGGANGNLFAFDETFIKTKYPQYDSTNHTLSLSNVLFTFIADNDGNITGVRAVGTPDVNLVLFVGKFIAKANVTYRIMLRTNSPNSDTFARASGPQDQFTYNYGTVNTTGVTFSVPSDTELWLNVRVKENTAVDYLFEPSLFLEAESDKSYRPYANICPISGRTEARVDTENEDSSESAYAVIQLGQTVYGADINWDTGVATVKTALDTFDGSNDENWELSSSGKRVYTNNLASVIKAPASGEIVANIISNEFKATSGNNTYAGNIGVSVDTTGLLGVSDGTGSMTASAFKTWLATNPLQVEYELATPTTIQLTPTQLQMLKGYNRVTIESGTITLDYVAKAISGNDEEIAPLVGDKATKSYAVNDFIERNDGLYRVTAPIASGASFTDNNTVKMSIGEALTYLYNK